MTNIGGNPYPGMRGPQTPQSFQKGWGQALDIRAGRYGGDTTATVPSTDNVKNNPMYSKEDFLPRTFKKIDGDLSGKNQSVLRVKNAPSFSDEFLKPRLVPKNEEYGKTLNDLSKQTNENPMDRAKSELRDRLNKEFPANPDDKNDNRNFVPNLKRRDNEESAGGPPRPSARITKPAIADLREKSEGTAQAGSGSNFVGKLE
jgi:hypothetical protein